MPTSYTGNVYWAIYNDVLNEPGSILDGDITTAITGVATGNSTGFGYAEYVFNIPVTFQLAAGNYWLALHNGPLSNNTPSEMLWSTTSLATGSSSLYLDLPNSATPNWISSGNEQAFRLDGTPVSTGSVPEPSTFALLCGSLLAISFLRRKSKQEKNIRRLIIFCLLGSSAAMAEVSGPVATNPAASALSDSIYDIALAGQRNSLNAFSATALEFKVHPLLSPPNPQAQEN